MSIAEDEAERVYPTSYWDGTHVKEKFYCDTDDLQEAYLRGREASRNGRPDMVTLDPVLFRRFTNGELCL